MNFDETEAFFSRLITSAIVERKCSEYSTGFKIFEMLERGLSFIVCKGPTLGG